MHIKVEVEENEIPLSGVIDCTLVETTIVLWKFTIFFWLSHKGQQCILKGTKEEKWWNKLYLLTFYFQILSKYNYIFIEDSSSNFTQINKYIINLLNMWIREEVRNMTNFKFRFMIFDITDRVLAENWTSMINFKKIDFKKYIVTFECMSWQRFCTDVLWASV